MRDFVSGVLRVVPRGKWQRRRASCASFEGHSAGPDGDRKEQRGEFSGCARAEDHYGEGMIASHGSREMPVWGPIFHQVEEDVDRGPVRLENLVKYLESLQTTKKT